MKIIFNMPFWTCPPNPEFVSQKAIIELSAAAEAAGFAGVAFTEHPAPGEAWRRSGGHDALDPFVGLAFAAAVTTRLRLLTYLVVLPYRNPFLLAKTAATLDALSGGRLILGLGAGYLEPEFRALGVNFEERNARFDESLDVLKLAWSGEPVTYKSAHFDAQAVTAQPRPAQRPHPPLWIGGNSKLTLRRVAEKAQGWMAMPSTPEQAARRRSAAMDIDEFEMKLEGLRAHAAHIQRDEPIALHYPFPEFSSSNRAETFATVRRLAALGVEWSGWNGQAGTLAAMKDEIHRFGDEVIAQLGS